MSLYQDQEIIDKFKSIDTDKDGYISIQELETLFSDLKLPISKRDIQEYCKVTDYRGVKISSDFFLQFYRSREKRIYDVYKKLDSRVAVKDGVLHQDALILRDSLTSLGLKASDDEIRNFIQYYDSHKNGKMSYNEFMYYLSSLPTNNPKAAFDEFLSHYSALKYGTSDYANQTTNTIDDFSTNGTNQSTDYPTSIPSLSTSSSAPSSSSSKQKYFTNPTIQLLSGGLAGIISRTGTAPLDRVKTFMQAGGKNAPKNFIMGVRAIYAQNGIISFYKGNGINCLKVAPETGLKMYSFELFKSLIAKDPATITFQERFVAGGIAGAVSQSIIYPLEIVKTRMTLSTPGLYRHVGDCILELFQQKGIIAFYRGLSMSVIGVIPYSGLDLMTNSILREMASTYYTRRKQEPGILSFLVCGMISSTVAMTATYPIGLLRTRLQASGMPGSVNYKSPTDGIIQIYTKEGLRGFFRGFGTNLIKVVPSSTISYGVYGSMSKLLSEI